MIAGYCLLRDHRLLSALTYVWRRRAGLRTKRHEVQARRRVPDAQLAHWFSNYPVSFPAEEAKNLPQRHRDTEEGVGTWRLAHAAITSPLPVSKSLVFLFSVYLCLCGRFSAWIITHPDRRTAQEYLVSISPLCVFTGLCGLDRSLQGGHGDCLQRRPGVCGQSMSSYGPAAAAIVADVAAVCVSCAERHLDGILSGAPVQLGADEVGGTADHCHVVCRKCQDHAAGARPRFPSDCLDAHKRRLHGMAIHIRRWRKN